jgi:poly-gamma-glutamate synthesis protein (capsule biosynthesis protein)
MKKLFFLFLFLNVFTHFLLSEEKRILKLTFLGDIMAHTANYLMQDYHPIYNRVKDVLIEDDLTFANLEFTIDDSRPYSSYPRFNVHSDYVQAAVDCGIEVFSLANNHSFDLGLEGVLQTLIASYRLRAADGREIYFSGIRSNLKQDFEPEIIYIGGLKIGFLAVTQFTNLYQPFQYIHAVNYRDRREVELFLEYLREKVSGFELFILSYHGGREYSLTAEPEKMRFFRELLSAGVNIVYGHHPHVMQPVQLVKVGDRNRVIISSAGNFISAMTRGINPGMANEPMAFTGDSALFIVEVGFIYGEATVLRVDPVFISNCLNEDGEIIVDKLERLKEQQQGGGWPRYYKERHRILTGMFVIK